MSANSERATTDIKSPSVFCFFGKSLSGRESFQTMTDLSTNSLETFRIAIVYTKMSRVIMYTYYRAVHIPLQVKLEEIYVDIKDAFFLYVKRLWKSIT